MGFNVRIYVTKVRISVEINGHYTTFFFLSSNHPIHSFLWGNFWYQLSLSGWQHYFSCKIIKTHKSVFILCHISLIYLMIFTYVIVECHFILAWVSKASTINSKAVAGKNWKGKVLSTLSGFILPTKLDVTQWIHEIHNT